MASVHTNFRAATLFAIVVCLSSVEVNGEVDCSKVPDGDYEVGCRVFVTCRWGIKTTIQCLHGQVYNGAGGCDLRENVPLPCGGPLKDCTGKNGRYADHDYGCRSFYTCVVGKNVGTRLCPSGLVYDEVRGMCEWPYNVPRPCGTLNTPWWSRRRTLV